MNFIYYDNFDWKEHQEESWAYELTFEDKMAAIRAYFDNFMVNIDGKDNDVWNVLVDLGVIDDILDSMEDWLIDYCKDEAFDAYKEYVEWYYDED